MKLDFTLPDDGRDHDYCIECHAEGVKTIHAADKTEYQCPVCGAVRSRRIHNGITKHWTAPDGTWWHESVGVFVRSPDGKFLFFERTAFPYGFTIPAGHVDKGEEPLTAADRELKEEVGIKAGRLKLIASVDISGDSCSGGSDDHHWYAYLEKDHPIRSVTVVEEGKDPVWLTLGEVLKKELPVPIRFLVERYRKQLEAV